MKKKKPHIADEPIKTARHSPSPAFKEDMEGNFSALEIAIVREYLGYDVAHPREFCIKQ